MYQTSQWSFVKTVKVYCYFAVVGFSVFSDSCSTIWSESFDWFLREGWNYFDEDLIFITSTTLIVPLEKKIAVLAGDVNHAMK
jgi:hypothetical protein